MKIWAQFKKIFTSFLGIIVSFPIFGHAEEIKIEQKSSEPSKETQPAKSQFTKEELINSLRDLRRNAKEIKTICAMCYKVAQLSDKIEFQCDRCGHTRIYERDSIEGRLAQDLPYIKRSLAQMPYKISVDSTGLCSVCGKDKNKVLLMNVSCFNCGKEFSWEVKESSDIDTLRWLYLKYPVIELDERHFGINETNKEEKIKKGTQYIIDHVFCPECRKNAKLDE